MSLGEDRRPPHYGDGTRSGGPRGSSDPAFHVSQLADSVVAARRTRSALLNWQGQWDDALAGQGQDDEARAALNEAVSLYESLRALYEYLDPISGGPLGTGWPFGRGGG